MPITQKTTVSIGLSLTIIMLVLMTFTECLPLLGEVVTKKYLEMNNKVIDQKLQSINSRITNIEKLLEKRFDKIDSKLENLDK
jgi:hypothetical protein